MKLTQGKGIIAIISGISLQMGNTWRRWTLLILMGSKEDTLQITLNKGDLMWGCLCRLEIMCPLTDYLILFNSIVFRGCAKVKVKVNKFTSIYKELTSL